MKDCFDLISFFGKWKIRVVYLKFICSSITGGGSKVMLAGQ